MKDVWPPRVKHVAILWILLSILMNGKQLYNFVYKYDANVTVWYAKTSIGRFGEPRGVYDERLARNHMIITVAFRFVLGYVLPFAALAYGWRNPWFLSMPVYKLFPNERTRG